MVQEPPKLEVTLVGPPSLLAPVDPSNRPSTGQPPAKHLSRTPPGSMRRPLRSSPLAGPSFSSQGILIESEQSPTRPRPSRISSTPDLPSIILTTSDDEISVIAVPPKSAKVPFARSLSHEAASDPGESEAARPRYVAFLSSFPNTPRVEPLAAPMKRSVSRESEKSIRSIAGSEAHLASRADNWLTYNTYDETPRFSRLGLSSSGVILPISARSSSGRQLSRMCSRTSMSSDSDVSRSPSVRSTCSVSDDGDRRPSSSSLPCLKQSAFRSNSTIFKDSSSTTTSSEDDAIDAPGQTACDRSDSTSSLNNLKRRSVRWGPITISSNSFSQSETATSVRSRTWKPRKGWSFLSFSAGETSESDMPGQTDKAHPALPDVEEDPDEPQVPAPARIADSLPRRGSRKADDAPLGREDGRWKSDEFVSHNVQKLRSGTVRRMWPTLPTVGRRR